MSEDITVIIFGAGSQIARNVFGKVDANNILGFTRNTKISKIIEYKSYNYTKLNSVINPHILVKKILPIMIKEKWGRFIFVGSSGALKTDVGISGYVAG